MTAENTTAAATIEDAKIEQSVKVYLDWDEVNKRWEIDPVTVDGHQLDGLDGADTDLFKDFWTPEIKAEIETANAEPLPNAEQLILLLLEALPAESTVKSALSEVLDAAGSWADELTTYIAPASEQFHDEESATSQRDSASTIRAAIELLRQ
ncbi:hypothetical protein [Arthrobacter sp. MAHUQ-56]